MWKIISQSKIHSVTRTVHHSLQSCKAIRNGSQREWKGHSQNYKWVSSICNQEGALWVTIGIPRLIKGCNAPPHIPLIPHPKWPPVPHWAHGGDQKCPQVSPRGVEGLWGCLGSLMSKSFWFKMAVNPQNSSSKMATSGINPIIPHPKWLLVP